MEKNAFDPLHRESVRVLPLCTELSPPKFLKLNTSHCGVSSLCRGSQLGSVCSLSSDIT